MIYILIVSLSFLLYCPVMTLFSAITPWQGFRLAKVRHRQRRYTTLHLAAFDQVGHLDKRRATRFHDSFISTLKNAIESRGMPVYFTSHLLRPAHMRSMKKLLTSEPPIYHWRCHPIRISRFVRKGIWFQMLLQEWRWVNVPETGYIVVIRHA